MALLCMYGAMIFFCFHIGHCAGSAFEALLCSGVGTLLAIQVICNAGVVTGTLPVTGMPLPLLSYGGSGLLCLLIGIGLVLGISREMGRNCEGAELGARDAGAKNDVEVDHATSAGARPRAERSTTARDHANAGTRPTRNTPARNTPARNSDRRVGITA
jgi:hypothetical protein